jgi:hypothetical protein
MCSIGLPCGHACPLKCHPGTDSDHSSIQCSTKVERACSAGHKYFTVCSKTAAAAAAASSCTSCAMLNKIQVSDAMKLSAQAAARQQAQNAAAVRLAEAQLKVSCASCKRLGAVLYCVHSHQQLHNVPVHVVIDELL